MTTPAEQPSSSNTGGKTLHINSTLSLRIEVDSSDPIHAPGILEEMLQPEKCLGSVDPLTVQRTEEDEKEQKPLELQEIPPIHQVVNIDDFEVL